MIINNRFFRVINVVLVTIGVLLPIVPLGVRSVNAQTFGRPASERVEPSVTFEENRGQFDPRVKFVAKGGGQTVFLTADEAAFVFPLTSKAPVARGTDLSNKGPDPEMRSHMCALKMKFAGASTRAEMAATGELEGKLNYFKGNDLSKWATDVPRYTRVVNRDVYDGIDMAWYGREDGRMEYDFIVQPDADAGQIRLEFDGADKISVDKAGDLVINTPAGAVRHARPVIYQETKEAKRPVEGGYVIDDGKVGFTLGDYDRSKTLTIDPIPAPPLLFSAFLGGSQQDWMRSVKLDTSNNIYVAGWGISPDFPVTSGTLEGGWDIFVTKIRSNGSAILYSAVIGGANSDRAHSIALDADRNAYITGHTMSSDFPTSLFAHDKTHNGVQDAYVMKLSPTGSSVVYSTYIGGDDIDEANSIALDSEKSAYITGTTESSNYPTSTNAHDKVRSGAKDVFVTKVSPSGGVLNYSTFLGGSSGAEEEGNGIAVDSLGRAYVTGQGYPDDFPVTPGSYASAGNDDFFPDCFITKLNSSGTGLVFSTLIGGNFNDTGNAIAIDSSGNSYITGRTSSEDYPVTLGAFSGSGGHPGDTIITKLNSAGTALNYSTYLGTEDGNTIGNTIALDSENSVYIAGSTISDTFPVTDSNYYNSPHGEIDAFIFKVVPSPFSSSSAAAVQIGGTEDDVAYGLALNPYGDVIITGRSESSNFPTTFGAFDTTFGGAYMDGFVLKYNNYWLF